MADLSDSLWLRQSILLDTVCNIVIAICAAECILVVFRWIRFQVEISAAFPVFRWQVLGFLHELTQEATRTIKWCSHHCLLQVVLRVDPVAFDVVVVSFLEEVPEFLLVLFLDGNEVVVKLINIFDTSESQAFLVLVYVEVFDELSVWWIFIILLLFVERFTWVGVNAVDLSLLFARLIHNDGVNFPCEGPSAF